MAFDDLRSFLAELEKLAEVHRIKAAVDKEWEVGPICRENFDKFGPALIFENIKGYRTPLVVGVLGNRKRHAYALGVGPDNKAIMQRWQKAYQQPIKPKIVERGPCQEVELAEVDLYAEPFPVPKWHYLDGGPELGTYHAVITKDPETGWINCGTYRNQILERDILGSLTIPYRHDGIHWEKWRSLGKPMPVAIALGLDPYLNMVSISAIPAQVDEYDIAGGLKGAPIEVVRAKTVDLLVPVRAEIILEGEMPTDRFYPLEGPFGEFPGYMGVERKDSHFIQVKKITHRRDPLFQGTYEGRPPNESTESRLYGRSAALYEHLRRAGIPGIKDVCITPGGCSGFHAVVCVKKMYPGHVRDIMGHVWGHPTLFCKHCIVVDEDIDPWDPFWVEWSIATRVQAGRDVEIVKNGKSIVLDPSQVPSRRGWSDLLGIDATKPIEDYQREGQEYIPSSEPPPESMERVRARWKEYGFKE